MFSGNQGWPKAPDFQKFVNKEPDPSIRSPEFELKDIEGHIVEVNTDYYLALYDHSLDVLQLDRAYHADFAALSVRCTMWMTIF